jgi:hypothetical protein
MVGTDLPSAIKYLEKAYEETPKELAMLEIEIGNEQIMADVIKEALTKGFEHLKVGAK